METRTEQTVDGAPADREALTKTLIGLLLADAFSDVEVIRRELCLGEQMIERLRRALDRLNCAQSVLEAAGTRQRGNSRSEVWKRVSEAVRVLAENWAQDYPEGAVEWLLVGSAGRINQGCSEPPG